MVTIYSNMKSVNVFFAERLKDLRTERNLSLKELARAIGVSDVAIGRWEKSLQIPNIIMLDLVARYFSTTPNYLLGYED